MIDSTTDRRSANGRKLRQLIVRQREVVDCHLASQLSSRMGTHSVRDNKKMATTLPLPFARRQRDDKRVLVVASTHSKIAGRGVFQRVVPRSRFSFHRRFRKERKVENGESECSGQIKTAPNASTRQTKNALPMAPSRSIGTPLILTSTAAGG